MKSIKLILLCAALGCASAFAATITISDPGCSIFTASAPGAALSVTCSTVAPTPPPVPPTPVPVPPPTSGCPAPTTMTSIDNSYGWDASTNATISAPQSIGAGYSIAFKFVAGASGAGAFSSVELPYLTASNRYATLTKCPGDFSTVNPTNSYCAVDGTGLSANIKFNVGSDFRGYCTLQTGQTYYFNIRHGVRDRVTGAIVDSSPGTYGFLLQMLHN